MKEKQNKEILIGKEIKITGSKNTSLVNLQGKIIDETKNTIIIKTNKGEKKLLKNQIKFMIIKEGIEINGKKIQKRLEERLK